LIGVIDLVLGLDRRVVLLLEKEEEDEWEDAIRMKSEHIWASYITP
jgi:hypothetical protein